MGGLSETWWMQHSEDLKKKCESLLAKVEALKDERDRLWKLLQDTMLLDGHAVVKKEPYEHKEHYSLLGDIEKVQETLNYWKKHVNNLIFEQYKYLFRGSMIDIGCNCGFSSFIAAELGGISEVVGVDVCKKAIEDAYLAVKALGLSEKVRFLAADFSGQIPDYLAGQFDCAISFHTMEHLYPEDVHPFVRNIHTVLKPHAPCLISIPYRGAHGSPEHMSFFSEGLLAGVFQSAGFDVSKCYRDKRSSRELGGRSDMLNGVFFKK